MATAALTTIFLATSCSTSQEVAEPEVSTEQWQEAVDEAVLAQLRFSVAQDILAGQCMRNQGFDYEENHSGKIVLGNSSSRDIVRDIKSDFDTWNPSLNGYRNPPSADEEAGEPVDPPSGVGDRPYDEAWFDAFFGPVDATEMYKADFGVAGVSASKEGCLGEAITLLGGQDAFEISGIGSAFTILFGEIDSRVMADDKVIDATERWSECMTSEGFRSSDDSAFESPDASREETLSKDPDAVEPSRSEILVATADRDCQANTGYIDHLIEAGSKHQTEVLNGDQAQALLLDWLEIDEEPHRLIDQVLEENLVSS